MWPRNHAIQPWKHKAAGGGGGGGRVNKYCVPSATNTKSCACSLKSSWQTIMERNSQSVKVIEKMTHRDVNIAEIGHSDIWTASAGQMSWDNLAYREREGSPPVWELKRQFKNTNSSSKSPSFSAHINEAILSPHYHRLLRKLWKYSFKRHSPHRKNFETKIQLRAKFNYFPLCFLNKTRESHSDRLAVQLS